METACSNNSIARSSFVFPYLFTNFVRYKLPYVFNMKYLNIFKIESHQFYTNKLYIQIKQNLRLQLI